MKFSSYNLIRLLLICSMLFFFHSAFAAQANDQVFILDASGSMWGQIEGKNKISIARDVMGKLIQQLPDDTKAGLVVYGHRRKGDCKDIETMAPLGPIDKSALSRTINNLSPKGKTPITDSVNQAIDLVRASERAANIILVSDGLETCGRDPCKAVREAKAAGVNFVMHVVGFGIEEKENVSSLECAAQAGGGLYFDAKNASELSAALEQVVEKPAVVTGGTLSIKAVADGKLSDVTIRVRDAATDEDIATGRTYRSEETNPRRILLPAGRYKATVTALEFKGDIQRQLDNIVIVEGETVEHNLDFSSGEISIKVLRNGKLSDASVNITRSGESIRIAGGRTYTSEKHNPASYKLTPGLYDMTVTPLEYKGAKKHVFENIEVKTGETHEELLDVSSGKISVKVLFNDKPGDATVSINDPDTGSRIAGGRTYHSANHNPKILEITPGIYNMTVEPVEFRGGKKKVIEKIEVMAGKMHEETVEYTTGTLALKVTENGNLLDATISVYPADSKSSVASGRTHTGAKHNPKLFKLATGKYSAIVTPVKVYGDVKHSIDNIEVNKGQTTELAQDYKTAVLQVSTLNGMEPVDAMIRVKQLETGQSITSTRSYAKMKEFHILPGDYSISASAIKLEGNPAQEIKVTLEAGNTIKTAIDFSTAMEK